MTVGRFVNALNLKFGWQLQTSQKLSVDVFTGIGIRDLNIRYLDGTSNENVRDNRFIFLLPFRSGTVSSYGLYGFISLGFCVGYLL